MTRLGNIWSKLTEAVNRKKVQTDDSSPLARVLNLLDLTALGVGTTLGVGVYVLAGTVAKTQAGPAVVLSFALAAVASLLAGFCYAEFAARVPRAGSVYVYAYVTIGELIAFVIGWDLTLEYAIGSASVARGISGYLDSLGGKVIANYLNETMPIRVPNLASYPDFFAFGLIMLVCLLLSMGVKESAQLNKLFTLVNLLTIATVVIAGAIHADPHNWNLSLSEIPANITTAGAGGFFPFGFKGVVSGAATSFFGFVGFDCIATTSEEAKRPRRNIPLAIILSLAVVFVAYFSVSAVLSMMRPYYLQDQDAPFPVAFNDLGMHTVKWIVTVGAAFALGSCLVGVMVSLPRVLYSIASDGLLFEFLSRVHKRKQTPLPATIVAGLLSGTMALLFDLTQLISMLSIGTLLAYSLVAICVLILRFSERGVSTDTRDEGTSGFFGLLVNAGKSPRPTSRTSVLAKSLIALYCVLAMGLNVYMAQLGDALYDGSWAGAVPLSCMGLGAVVVLVILSRQPRADVSKLSFASPMVPVLPCISIFLNFYLMTELDIHTWLRFIIWLTLGAVVYFSYSIRHSKERLRNKMGTNKVLETNPAYLPPVSYI